MNNTPPNTVCNTTHDIINHKLILHSLIDAYNQTCDNGNKIFKHKKNELSNLESDERKRLYAYIEHIASDDLLYSLFDEILKCKYQRFISMNPYFFEERHVMATLTALDYIRHILSTLPVSFEETNKRLVDILNYDSHKWNESVQARRQSLMEAWVPLVDEHWIEVIKVDEKFDPWYVFNWDLVYTSFRLFSVQREIDDREDCYILIGPNWIVVKDKDNNEVYPHDVKDIIVGLNGTFLKRNSLFEITNDLWEILIDVNWNEIIDIKSAIMIWDNEYFEVISKWDNNPYYINSETGDVLYINWDSDRIVRDVKWFNDNNWLYQVIEWNSNMCFIYSELQEYNNVSQIRPEVKKKEGEKGWLKLVK